MVDLRQLQEEYHQVTEDKLTIGALVETVLGEEDGLILSGLRKQRTKKMVVVGIDKDEALCFGSVLVNSLMNPRSEYSDEYLQAQYLIKKENYPDFLEYDSYVDCAILFSIPVQKLLRGKYFGILNDDDRRGIFEVLETTETLTTK